VKRAVFKDDAILLVRAPSIGRESWTLPGGSAEINESPSQTMAREIREETGFLTEVEKLVEVSSGTTQSGIGANLFFQCRIISGKAETSDETVEIIFFKEKEASSLDTWGPTGEQIVRLYEHYRNPSLPAEFGVPPWV
jgi:ADP-ribose pyrophosphatase YjhB (NUDIX family)